MLPLWLSEPLVSTDPQTVTASFCLMTTTVSPGVDEGMARS